MRPRQARDRAGTGRAYGRILGLALLAAPAAPGRADDAVAPPAALSGTLSGAEAWSRIVGNTVSGRTPDGPYSEFFAPGGSFTIVDGDGKGGGRWTLRDGRLCTQAEGEDEEECREVSVTGAAGAFVDAAGSRYPFEIEAGNAKGL